VSRVRATFLIWQVVFVESLPSPWLIGYLARFLYVTDMVRVPQYRNCLMIARRGHPAMRATLDAIVAKFKSPPPMRPPEPTYTLELTGPGIFTDAVKSVTQGEGPLDPPGTAAVAAVAALKAGGPSGSPSADRDVLPLAASPLGGGGVAGMKRGDRAERDALAGIGLSGDTAAAAQLRAPPREEEQARRDLISEIVSPRSYLRDRELHCSSARSS